MKADLIAAATRRALAAVLEPIVDAVPADELIARFGDTPADRLAAGWYRREAGAVEEVETRLAGAELSMDVVKALALQMSLGHVERIDRMITNAEARRIA